MKKVTILILVLALIVMQTPICPLAESYAGTNLLRNNSFEDGEGITVTDWLPGPSSSDVKGWGNVPYASVDTTRFHGGTRSVKLETTNGDAYVYQSCVELAPGTRYKLSVWAYVENRAAFTVSKPLRFKLEFNSKLNYDMTTSNVMPSESGKWMQSTTTFTAPADATRASVHCRLYQNGTVWIDDLELVPLEEKKIIDLRADQYFYYPEVETGYASAEVFDQYKTTYKNATVDFKLENPQGVTIASQNGMPLTDGIATFDFSIAPLRVQQKKAFILSATLKNGETIVDTTKKEIYCYPRPALLNEDGFILNEDGSVFSYPVLGYHVNGSREGYEAIDNGNFLFSEVCKEMGIRLVPLSTGAARMYYNSVKNETDEAKLAQLKQNSLLKKWLDQLQEQNMKAFVSLYEGMEAAAHPINIETTKRVVADFKDHPAVGGWCVMDEPFDMLTDAEYWLALSYKTIRDIDDKHPVYFVDNSTDIHLASAYADIVAADPYISYPSVTESIYENYPTCGNNPAAYPSEVTQILRRTAERYGKGFLILNQAYRYNGYTPSLSELRSFWYQSMFEGAHGAGWYEVLGSDGIITLEKEGCGYQTYLKAFSEEEQLVATELLGRESRYPLFDVFESADYAYKGIVKNGDLYLLIINRHADVQTISVPLRSQNGLISVGGTPEELYKTDEGVNPVVSGGMLTVTMPAASVSLVRFACAVASATRLALPCFTDLDTCETETAKAIEQLFRKDILEEKGDRLFLPEKNVTRGDFVKYLIRTLELETMSDRGQTAENFKDVSETATYYREVRVARSLNIARGAGDNTFSPETAITKAEAEILCERALRSAKKAGTSLPNLGVSFSENNTQNLTREEAAVIMQNLLTIGSAN
ncbi:MAG: S-layer homology domain-containing protein [Clostridia bacterium]|nr:S-layer homology domain-containing protein [Clostridia bacterium]